MTLLFIKHDKCDKVICGNPDNSESKGKIIKKDGFISTSRKGFGNKFGRLNTNYHSQHIYVLINGIWKYSNTYIFGNGDISSANYVKTSN